MYVWKTRVRLRRSKEVSNLVFYAQSREEGKVGRWKERTEKPAGCISFSQNQIRYLLPQNKTEGYQKYDPNENHYYVGCLC